MTVIVGILCSDGVVIGSDSAMAAGRAHTPTGYTIERQEGDVLKLEIIDKNVITAGTGAMGLAQRFNHQAEVTIKELRAPFQPSQTAIQGIGILGTKVQQIFSGKVATGTVLYDTLKPVEIGTVVSEAVIDDFKRTQSTHQVSNGWGFGALFAFAHGDQPHLIDFDPVQFHAELKGQPDPERGDQDRIWRCVTWGRGQQLGDAFLAHVYRLLFGEKLENSNEWKLKRPRVDRAKIAVAWTIDHVRRYNTGLVGGKLQLAVLEKQGANWVARYEDPGETEGQVDSLEKNISDYIKKLKPDAAAEAPGTVDIKAALKPSSPSDGL